MTEPLTLVTTIKAEGGEQQGSESMCMRVAERDRLLQMLYECAETMDAAADVTDECAQKELGPCAAQALRVQQGSLLRAITQAIALLEAATPQSCAQVIDDEPLDLESVREAVGASTLKSIAPAVVAAAASPAGQQRGARRYAWGPAPLKALPRTNLPTSRLATTSSSVTNTLATNRANAARNVALSGAKTLTSRPNSRSSTAIRTVQKASAISSKSSTSFAPRPVSRVSSRRELPAMESSPTSRKTSRLRFANGLPSATKEDKRSTPASKASNRGGTAPLSTPGALKRCITSF